MTNKIMPRTPAGIYKILSLQKCRIYPGFDADILHLKHNVETSMICLSYIYEDDISSKTYLYFREALKAYSGRNLIYYSVLTDPSLSKTIFFNFNIYDSDKYQIDVFF